MHVDAADLQGLADTIRTDGLINPITLRSTDSGYQLIAGSRRLAAVRLLGWSHVPATIRPDDDPATHRVRLVENLARANLTPIEEAAQLADLVEHDDTGVDRVAAQIGRTPGWIQDRLEILTWPDFVQAYIHTKRMSLAVAQRLVRISDPALREQRCHEAAAHGITAAQASLWLQDANRQIPDTPPLSENSCQVATEANTMTTYATCFVCRQPKPLETTSATRVCSACLRDLAQTTGRTIEAPMLDHP
jgi:ParB family chromosome partitioning protein